MAAFLYLLNGELLGFHVAAWFTGISLGLCVHFYKINNKDM
jgi:hypothetical protein